MNTYRPLGIPLLAIAIVAMAAFAKFEQVEAQSSDPHRVVIAYVVNDLGRGKSPGGFSCGPIASDLPIAYGDPATTQPNWERVRYTYDVTDIWDWHYDDLYAQYLRVQQTIYDPLRGCDGWWNGTYAIGVKHLEQDVGGTVPPAPGSWGGRIGMVLPRVPYNDGTMPRGDWFIVYYPDGVNMRSLDNPTQEVFLHFGWKFLAEDSQLIPYLLDPTETPTPTETIPLLDPNQTPTPTGTIPLLDGLGRPIRTPVPTYTPTPSPTATPTRITVNCFAPVVNLDTPNIEITVTPYPRQLVFNDTFISASLPSEHTSTVSTGISESDFLRICQWQHDLPGWGVYGPQYREYRSYHSGDSWPSEQWTGRVRNAAVHVYTETLPGRGWDWKWGDGFHINTPAWTLAAPEPHQYDITSLFGPGSYEGEPAFRPGLDTYWNAFWWATWEAEYNWCVDPVWIPSSPDSRVNDLGYTIDYDYDCNCGDCNCSIGPDGRKCDYCCDTCHYHYEYWGPAHWHCNRWASGNEKWLSNTTSVKHLNLADPWSIAGINGPPNSAITGEGDLWRWFEKNLVVLQSVPIRVK